MSIGFALLYQIIRNVFSASMYFASKISKRIEIQVLAYAGFECLQLKQLHRAATMAQSHNGDLWTRITAAHESLRQSRVETPVCKCCCPVLWKRLWGKCKETNHSVVKGMKSLAFLNQMRSLSLPDILFMSTIIKWSMYIYSETYFRNKKPLFKLCPRSIKHMLATLRPLNFLLVLRIKHLFLD